MKRNLSLVFILLFLVSCGGQFQQMKPVDKAGSIAKEISLSYINLYTTADNLTKNGAPPTKVFMKEKVNPKMNEAKLSIAAMDRAVAYWKDTGNDGLNTQAKQNDLIKLLEEIAQLISQAPNGGK